MDYYGDRIINHPVGTGPFVLKTWNRGSYIELVRNPNYRDDYYPSEGEADDRANGLLDDAGRRLPLADRIVSVVVEEDPPRWFLFMRGKIDISGIPKDNFSEAISGRGVLDERMRKLNISLTTFRDPSTYWIAFNMEDPVLGPSVMQVLRDDIRGCPEPYEVVEAGHFVPEWGEAIARRALSAFD